MANDKLMKPAKDQKTGRFLPGNNGGKGRPKGARNKLSEAFLNDIFEDWAKHGKEAIERVRKERPHDYVKIVASLLPKEVNLTTDPLSELSDGQLEAQINRLAEQLGLSVIRKGALN